MLFIPSNLWNSIIIVPNKEKFLCELEKGNLTEYKLVMDLTKGELKEYISKGWKNIKFGINCVMP